MLVVFAFTIASCGKGPDYQPASLKVTSLDSGKTVNISKKQTIALTLGNPGDGGYDFDAPKFDQSVLLLINHVRNFPPKNSPIGDFGTDTWVFSAKSSGSTMLTVTASRSWDPNNPLVIFSDQVAVH